MRRHGRVLTPSLRGRPRQLWHDLGGKVSIAYSGDQPPLAGPEPHVATYRKRHRTAPIERERTRNCHGLARGRPARYAEGGTRTHTTFRPPDFEKPHSVSAWFGLSGFLALDGGFRDLDGFGVSARLGWSGSHLVPTPTSERRLG